MNYNMLRRGVVWLIDEVPINGHIQGGVRPWVIVSNNACNKFSPVIHIAPITSQNKKPMPTHVEFKNPKGDRNIILCEQIIAINVSDIKGRDMYELSQATMDRVDKAIGVQFGCIFTPITYSDVEDYFNRMEEYFKNHTEMSLNLFKQEIEKEYEEKLEAFKKEMGKLTTQVPSNVVTSVSDMAKVVTTDLSKLAKSPKTREKAPNPHTMSQVEKFERKWGTKKEEPKQEEIQKPKEVGNYKWSLENIKDFFKTYAESGVDGVCEKFKLNPAGIPAYKSSFLKKYRESFTKEQKASYVADCKVYSIGDMMAKWSIPSKRDVMKFRSAFEVELGE